MSEQANVSKLQEMYAAFSRGDVDTILRNVTDDCDWGTESVIASAVPWYIVRYGREGVGDFFSTLASEVDFQSFVPSVFAGTGDRVFVKLDYEYKFRKNGRSAATGAVHEFTFRDGNVARFRAYEDTAAVKEGYSA